MPKLYHITGWRDLAKKDPGDTFTLKPGQQHAEGPGVYFSQDVPVKVTTAEGTAQSGAAAVVETEASSAAGWWRTKPSIARKFNRPITWHTDGKSLSCEVQDVGEIPVTGSGTLPLLKSECSFSRVAARYQSKKKIETKDGDEATVYEYGPRQIANRHKEKAERVEHLRQHISDLRARVKDDLKSDDPMTQMTALAVSLMDHTCERVGNDDSADDGHYGVTGWLKKHITIRDGKATIKYVGKSGVKHEKTVDDGPTVTALKELCEGRDGDEAIFDTDDAKVSADEVNDYLAEFDVTAKDIRGYRANDEMCKALRAERAKGPKELPRARKEKDEILKAEFKRALETVAEVVGHEASTLRSQYLVPGLEDQYVHDGTVIKSLKVAGTYQELPVHDANIPAKVRAFFNQNARFFDLFSNLWVKGGAARNALLSVLTGSDVMPPRDLDVVLFEKMVDPQQRAQEMSQILGLSERDVEVLPSIQGYFSSRDLGVNEVLLRPDRVLFTEKARRDALKGMASPSASEFDLTYKDVTPRVALRGILIALREGLKVHPLLVASSIRARPFDLLIHLFKAFDSSVEDRFFEAVRENPHLRGVRAPEDALFSLLNKVWDFRLTREQGQLLQRLRREDEYGNRYATKTDAEREDEATEKLVKPSPKKKPPRHDLRNERVESDDPDLDDTDDDLSLNFKKVASPVRVAMAVRVAARYLWAKGKANRQLDEEFLKSVEGKLFKTPKSDQKGGVSYSHLKKIDPDKAKEERDNWVKGKRKEKGKQKTPEQDQAEKREKLKQHLSPATSEEVQQSVEKIQSSEAAKSLSESDRERVSDLISSVMSGQKRVNKEKLEAGIEQHNAGNVEKLKGGVDRKTVDALRRVPKGIYGEGVKMSTFDSKKSGELIAKKQKSREKVEKDYEQARNDVRDLPSEIKESEDREKLENQDLVSETKTLKELEAKVESAGENADPKDKADITRLKSKVSTRQRTIQKLKVTRDASQKKLDAARKRLPSLKDAYEKETSELNAMTAYHVSQEHLSSHLTDMSKGSDNPTERLSEAAKHLSSLPPEMADKAREGAKSHRDQIKKDYDNAAEEDREALKKELDLADSVVAAGVHDKYLRMDEKEAEDDNKASFIRTLHESGVGVDDEYVQALLREGSNRKEVASAVHNLVRKMPKGALAQREFGDTYEIFKNRPNLVSLMQISAVESLVSEFQKGRVKDKADKGKADKGKADKDKADRVKQLAEVAQTEDLTDEQRAEIQRVVREQSKGLPPEEVTDLVELDIPSPEKAKGDKDKEGGPSSPGEYRQMLLDNATDEEARKQIKDLSSEELNEKWEAYKSKKTARLLNPRRIAARFLAYSTAGR